MNENRKQNRVDINVTARLFGSAAQQETRISDLSEGGCYVDSIAEVCVGGRIFIKILVSAAEWLELEGVVVHCSPGLGFGVRFENFNEEGRRYVLSLIHRANPALQQDPAGSWRVAQVHAYGPTA